MLQDILQIILQHLKKIHIIIAAAVFVVVTVCVCVSLLSCDDESVPEEVSAAGSGEPFVGRMVMPSSADFVVLDNSAERDIEKIATFIQGRATGLHWVSSEHFLKESLSAAKVHDIHINMMLTIDSLGHFSDVRIAYCDTEDKEMLDRLVDQISSLWMYRRSAKGVTKIEVPFTWTSKY